MPSNNPRVVEKEALFLPSIVLVALLACGAVRAADDRVLYGP